MHSAHYSAGTVRFGPFEVDLELGVLRKHGIRIKLQAQPFEVLRALLEHPGSVVTREDLRRRLWPQDTFVDFEHGLNAAVTRLRQALGDSAERPRYVETLSKRGYRLTVEVECPSLPPLEEIRSVPLANTNRKPPFVIAAALLFAAVGVGALHVASRKPVTVLSAVPLTTLPGIESGPALSPEGSFVAFSWDGPSQNNFDIYVMPIFSSTPRRLTSDAGPDFNPAWSPDGRSIAFFRRFGDDGAELLLVPAAGGPEHKIAEVRNTDLRTGPLGLRLLSAAWSPDGRWLSASHRAPGDPSERIYLFSLTGEKRPLTSPPAGDWSDHMPTFSPDGRSLAFCRLPGFSTSEIYRLPLDANLRPDVEVRKLTNHRQWSTNPVWIQNGKQLLYVYRKIPNEAERTELRVIDPESRGRTERTVPLSDGIFQISAGRHLVYTKLSVESNIWRAAIPPSGEPPSAADLFIASTRPDASGRYSPDGEKIAFVSSRSGSPEIWIATAAGTDPIRVTSFGGPMIGPPAWSPDGQWLAFHARPDGQADLFLVPAAGGSPRRITYDASDQAMPGYSPDGRWIYHTSRRSGPSQIWRISPEGKDATQITKGGGLRPVVSADGKTVYYAVESKNAIWQVPAEGGEEREVVAPVHPPPFGFAITPEGVHYPAPPHAGDQRYLRFHSFATGKSRPVVRVDRPFGYVVSLSRDRKYVLLDLSEKPAMDLMLVENFRPH